MPPPLRSPPHGQPSPLAPVFVPASQLAPPEQQKVDLREAPSSSTDAPKRAPRNETPCRYFIQGYCARGNTCWYRHENPKDDREKDSETATVSEPKLQEEKESCAICFDVPKYYGLMTGCDHVFCLDCIRQWRSTSNPNANNDRSDEQELTNTSKTCPLCRVQTRYVIPSHIFPTPPSDGSSNTQKAKIEAVYRRRLSSIPCRYFKQSLERVQSSSSDSHQRRRRGPHCPFGNDCHYKHQIGDGNNAKHYTFTKGELNRHRWEQRTSRRERRIAMELGDGYFGDYLADDMDMVEFEGIAVPGFRWGPRWVIEFLDNPDTTAASELRMDTGTVFNADGYDDDEPDEEDDDDGDEEEDFLDIYYESMMERIDDDLDPESFF